MPCITHTFPRLVEIGRSDRRIKRPYGNLKKEDIGQAQSTRKASHTDATSKTGHQLVSYVLPNMNGHGADRKHADRRACSSIR